MPRLTLLSTLLPFHMPLLQNLGVGRGGKEGVATQALCSTSGPLSLSPRAGMGPQEESGRSIRGGGGGGGRLKPREATVRGQVLGFTLDLGAGGSSLSRAPSVPGLDCPSSPRDICICPFNGCSQACGQPDICMETSSSWGLGKLGQPPSPLLGGPGLSLSAGL